MHTNKQIVVLRDCDAVQIPSGEPVVIPEGTEVIITQSLGGSYTVATPHGLAKIAGTNADALGIEVEKPVEKKGIPSDLSEEAVWEVLKTCYDPEIPVNIVDLGLVYDCKIVKQENGQTSVEVKMTLTAPGCGMGPTIAAEAEGKILSLNGADEARVELVWEPAWNQGMISEVGRMKLGMI